MIRKAFVYENLAQSHPIWRQQAADVQLCVFSVGVFACLNSDVIVANIFQPQGRSICIKRMPLVSKSSLFFFVYDSKRFW